MRYCLKKKDLLRHYITLPTLLTFVGAVLGLALAFTPIGIKRQMMDSYDYFSLPDHDYVYPPYLMIYLADKDLRLPPEGDKGSVPEREPDSQAVGGLICIPAAKFVMGLIYPSFIANVACCMDISYPWYTYLSLYCAMLLIYLLINTLLMRRINRITPAEVLKNRE